MSPETIIVPTWTLAAVKLTIVTPSGTQLKSVAMTCM